MVGNFHCHFIFFGVRAVTNLYNGKKTWKTLKQPLSFQSKRGKLHTLLFAEKRIPV